MTISKVTHEDCNYVCVKCNCGFFIQHNAFCCHFYCLFHEVPHVSQFPPQCLHAWALTYIGPGKEDATVVLSIKKEIVDFEVHGGVIFPHGAPVTSYVDPRMTSTDIACF